MKYAREVLALTGRGEGAAATLPQVVSGGVLAWAVVTTLPSTPARVTLYVLCSWLLTRMPSGALTGKGDGEAAELGVAGAVGDPEADAAGADETEGEAEWP